ncbi:MAG: TVP38/TMEM64 family protein [Lachnospiraceae bacterium]|nr:TVP38/TMEM64 family protein [Lachnospiraceae bacterium]
MEIRENSFWYKLKEKLIPVLVVIAVAILIWFAFGDKIPGLIPLLKEGDSQKIADYLAQETGIKGVIAVILLQAVQVASIVMPGMAIQVAAGLIYGWLKGFLMCYIGFVVSNLCIFLFARKMGSDRIRDVSMSRTSQWLLEKLNGTNPKFMVVVANMVPAIPNGIIPYIAAKTDITALDYVKAVAMGSWLQILLSCLAGQFIINGQWLYTVLAIVFQFVVVVIILWKREWFLERTP